MASHELKDFHRPEAEETDNQAHVWVLTRLAILWAAFLSLAPFVVEFTRG